MSRLDERLGQIQRVVDARVKRELTMFMARLEARLDPATFERVLEITAEQDGGIRRRGQRQKS